MSDASTLKLRLLADSKNPLTFLVGSPFSLHNGCGVPGIDEFVKIAKSFVAAKGTKHLTALNDHLGQSSGSTAYQSTMKWLYDVFTASGVKEVVQKAVLQARLATAPALDPLSGVDGQPTEWQLTPSQTGLARFIKHNPSKFSGNILTTNFDPLMEMALKKEGLTAHTRHFVADGSFETFTPTTGDHQVFHMHGFWRSNDTMHTISQINAKRSHTETSLRSLLDHTDLIVLAYSGWEDILTKVIADRMNDPGFHGTVAWCFHEKSEKDARSKYETVFQRFSGGILQNRISYFYDIDCHTIFDDLVPKDSTPPITAGSVAAPSLTGWQKVTAEYFALASRASPR